VIGPQAPLLLHPLVQGMTLGQTVDQLARDVLHIHPALTEVVELALLDL
jgi:mycothione reductase